MPSGFRAPERVVRAQSGLHEHAVWGDLPDDGLPELRSGVVDEVPATVPHGESRAACACTAQPLIKKLDGRPSQASEIG